MQDLTNVLDSDNQLLLLLRAIVLDTVAFASEREIFDLESERLWKHFHEGGDPARAFVAAHEGDFEFGGAVVGVLQFVGLLWATYKMADEIRKRITDYRDRRSAALVEVRNEWLARLVQSGLPQEVAEEIVQAHGLKAVEAVFFNRMA